MARPKKSTVRGMSLHIGLNAVDPKHYQGWSGRLAACEFDAKDMHVIAKKQNFQTHLLLTRRATFAAVSAAINAAAQKLRPGDHFLITYSGHGGQVPDKNGDEGEDGKDETWVLFDRELIDDELYALWSRFQAGVRILMLSDSCHSGTVARMVAYRDLAKSALFSSSFEDPIAPRFRAIPPDIASKTYHAHRKMYDAVQRNNPAGERAAVGATIILISGCQDNQLSGDGPRNGVFTAALRSVWANGQFRDGHRAFHKAISRIMPPYQTPNYFRVGGPDLLFERQRPFAI